MVLSCNQLCMLLAVATNNTGKGTQRIPRGRCRQFERKRCTRCALHLSHSPTSNPAVSDLLESCAERLGAVFYLLLRKYIPTMQPVPNCKEFTRPKSDPECQISERRGRKCHFRTGLPDCDHQVPCTIRDLRLRTKPM